MAKSLNPDDYPTELERIFAHIWEHLSLDIGPLTKREAESLRWDLYAYRKALKTVKEPRAKDYELISFSLVRGETNPDGGNPTYTLSGQVGGSIWTRSRTTICEALQAQGGENAEGGDDSPDFSALERKLGLGGEPPSPEEK